MSTCFGGGKKPGKHHFFGVNWYDYGARFYDPALPGFGQIDPRAEEYYSWSPYTYCGNNPIRRVDINGEGWGDVLDWVQTGLDVAGMVPAVGNIADLANAGISAARGDMVGMGLSLAAAVPGAGLVAGGAKLVNRAVDVAKTVDKATDVAKAVDKATDATKAIDKGADAMKAIGPAGDAGGTVMKQLPDNMQSNMKTTKNGQGTIFKDPNNPSGNNVRVQSGNPNSPNPAQQNPYVKQVKDGKTVDVNGKQVDPKSAESHIPKEEFKYK